MNPAVREIWEWYSDADSPPALVAASESEVLISFVNFVILLRGHRSTRSVGFQSNYFLVAEERICADIRTLKELTPDEASQSNQNVRVVIIFYQHMFWPRSCKPLPAPGRGFICISGRSFRKRLTRTCKALPAPTLGEVFLPEAFFTRGRAGRLGES